MYERQKDLYVVGSGKCRDSKWKKKGILETATRNEMTLYRVAKSTQITVTLKVQNFFLEHMVVFCGIVGPLIICATLLLVLKSAHMQLSRKWAMESDCSG